MIRGEYRTTSSISVTVSPLIPQIRKAATPGLPAEGNLFLYEIAPTLTIVADDASRAFAMPNPAFTFTSSGMIDGDTLDTALSEPLVLTTSAVVTRSLPTTIPSRSARAVSARHSGTGSKPAPGILTVTERFKDNPVFDPSPDVPIDKRVRPVGPALVHPGKPSPRSRSSR